MVPRKYNYEKILSVGMPFLYEEGKRHPRGKYYPRWDFNSSAGYIDYGKTGLLYEAEVIAIQDGKAIFAIMKLPGVNYQIPVSPLAPNGYGKIYNPYQWEWDGFFEPDGGWAQYLPVSAGTKICGCGAEAFARLTNTPVSGHGTYCEKWSRNPYQG